MKVLTLAKVFPKYHPRAGEPTGFRDAFLSGRKIHTLRANVKGKFRDGDVVSVREWEGVPYRSKQVVIRDGVRIGLQHIVMSRKDGFVWGSIGGTVIAENDGLRWQDFTSWFFRGDGDYEGDIIHFTDFRY